MEIKSLADTRLETIFKAFNSAFSDYEVQYNFDELKSLWLRRGYKPDLSFAAFEGNDIVAFTLNGIGTFKGLLTAYDTGTGTLPDYRGQGLATKIFEYSIPFLKRNGVHQYVLEVLQHNAKAISVYQSLGFEKTREFNYFMQNNDNVCVRSVEESSFELRRIDVLDEDIVSCFWDFNPSWQNSFESIKRAYDNFIFLGAFNNQTLIGYAVFDPSSGDVTQIAVDQQNRRCGAGSLLLKEICKLNKHQIIKLVNTEIECLTITQFLESHNIIPKGKQFEMIRKL